MNTGYKAAGRPDAVPARRQSSVQWRAMVDGIGGNLGDRGNVESASYLLRSYST
jgi:hypothetical protein